MRHLVMLEETEMELSLVETLKIELYPDENQWMGLFWCKVILINILLQN